MVNQNTGLREKVILITGVAGFIGANLAQHLLADGKQLHIVGIDNLNDYYDVSLKEWRLRQIEEIATKNGEMCGRLLRDLL